MQQVMVKLQLPQHFLITLITCQRKIRSCIKRNLDRRKNISFGGYQMKKFSKDFMIGAATAAHQVEGNNKNSDFWLMEHVPGSVYKEPSLDAVDHYNRFREDIKLMAEAGLDTYRFSIEWARI